MQTHVYIHVDTLVMTDTDGPPCIGYALLVMRCWLCVGYALLVMCWLCVGYALVMHWL